MPGRTELTPKQSEKVRSYFSRNYIPGEKIIIPDRKGEDWIAWMRSRLKEIRFYDEYGMRVGNTHEVPPRILLRGDATKGE